MNFPLLFQTFKIPRHTYYAGNICTFASDSCFVWEDPNVHTLSFINSALDKNVVSVSQYEVREKICFL